MAETPIDILRARRHLVDEGFLDRDHGRYRRSGGRVDVELRLRATHRSSGGC